MEIDYLFRFIKKKKRSFIVLNYIPNSTAIAGKLSIAKHNWKVMRQYTLVCLIFLLTNFCSHKLQRKQLVAAAKGVRV